VALQTVPPSRWNDEAAAPPPCGDRDSRERDGNVLKADLIGSRGLHIKASEGAFCRQTTRNAECYTASLNPTGLQRSTQGVGTYKRTRIRWAAAMAAASADEPLRCAKSYRIGVKAPLDRIDGVETCRVDDGQVAGVQRWVEPDELVFCVSVS
jgi:hypothetical protein